MSASIRGRKRRAGRRRGIGSPQPETCYVCGRVGDRRSMRTRKSQRVCLNTAACMDKVLNPPPPPVVYASEWLSGLDASKITSGTLQTSAFTGIMQALETIPDGFKELGHLSEQTANTFDKWAKGPW